MVLALGPLQWIGDVGVGDVLGVVDEVRDSASRRAKGGGLPDGPAHGLIPIVACSEQQAYL